MAENTVNRESLSLTLEDRYKKSKTVGGAFNAKSIETAEGKTSPVDGVESRFTANDFVVKMKQGESQFVDVKNGKSGVSMFLKGFSNQKYKG